MVAYATIITDILRHVKERAENGLKKSGRTGGWEKAGEWARKETKKIKEINKEKL